MEPVDSSILSSELNIDPSFIHCMDVTDSTNSEAKRLASAGAPEGSLVVASSQTQGRGRLARRFYSPEGTGLYMSIILRPQLPPDKVLFCTTLAAVSVCESIETLFPAEAKIKWVNDIIVDGKKVCGILAEGVFRPSGALDCVILGIGVNISVPAPGFPDEIASIAGALTRGTPDPHIRETLCAGIYKRFMGTYPIIRSAPHYEKYCTRSLILGEYVNVFRPGHDPYPARAMGITPSFALAVRRDDGIDELLFSGEVSVRAHTIL